MNKAVMFGIGILIVACGSGVVHAAKPDPLGIVFEDKPLRWWLEELGGKGDLDDYEKALAALPRFCAKPERAIPALTAALADKDAFVRVAAVQCLGYYCGTDVKALVPPLLKTLQTDEAGFVRAEAACSLSVVAPEDKTVLVALLKALKEDKDAKVRAEVIRRFRYNHGFRYKKSPASIFPAVLEAMKDPDDDVRIGAVFAVGEIGDPKITIPLLIDALKDHGVVGSNAPSALGDLCPAAIPALCEAMKDKAPGVRAGAVKALWYASSGRSGINARILKELPTIMALLDDKESNVRACAVSTRANKSRSRAPALTAKLDDVDWEVRRACISALGSIGPDAAAAVEKVIERLKNDREPLVRLEAAQALGSIGSKAKAAVPTLIEALKDKDADVVLWAAHALGRIGPDAKAAVPAAEGSVENQGQKIEKICERSSGEHWCRLRKEKKSVRENRQRDALRKD